MPKVLSRITKLTFQMDTAEVPYEKLIGAIELIGGKVKGLVNK